MTAKACPQENTLQAFSAASLPAHEAAGIERHLDECAACRRAVALVAKGLVSGDSTVAAAEPDEVVAGNTIGRYLVQRTIGAGAMGVVFAAKDPELDREVALKLVRVARGPGGEGATRGRVLREGRAIARLSHPHVVSVYDVGTHGGDVFIAMELAQNGSLRDVLAARRRAPAEVLALYLQAADGLAAAHDAGLVHRDFKPDNVLLGDDGRAKVADFGLARIDDDEPLGDGGGEGGAGGGAAAVAVPGAAALRQTMTESGVLLGTPAYMAPEILSGGRAGVGSDLFAFAVSLYEGLYGERPFAGGSLAALLDEVKGGRVRPAPAGSTVPAWLRAVVLRGLSAEPSARWPSMRAFADALRDDPSVARRRRRLVAGLAAAIVGTLLTIGGVSVERVIKARDAAEAAQARAEAATRVAESRANALLLSRSSALLEVDPTAALATLEGYPDGGDDWTGVASLATDAWSRGVARHVFRTGGELAKLVFSPDGRWIAGAGTDKLVHVWDAKTGAERRLLGHEGEVSRLLVTPDGRSILGAGPFDKRISMWDVETGEDHPLEAHEDAVRWIGVSATGLLVSTSRDRTLRVWDLPSGQARIVTRYESLLDCARVAISDDGRRIAYGGTRRVHLLDATTGAELPLEGHEVGTGSLAFSADGTTLVSGGMDTNVRAWDLTTGKLQVLRGHKAWVSALSLAPDGRTLATTSGDGTVRLWNLSTGEGRELPASIGDTNASAFSGDGRLLAMAGDDRLVRVWEMPSMVLRIFRGHAAPVTSLAFSPDGATLASASLDRTARAWDLGAGGLRSVVLPEGLTSVVAPGVRGDRFAFVRRSIDYHHTWVYVADTKSGAARALGKAGAALPASAALAPDGSALGDDDDGLRRYVMDGASCGGAQGTGDVLACAYAPDGKHAAWGGIDKVVHLHDLVAGTNTALGRHDGTVVTVAFSPDGRLLATGGTDRTVRVWDLAAGTSRELRGHDDSVEGVAFSADGGALGSVSLDGTLRVWDLATGAARVFGTEQLAGRAVAFMPDGRSVLVGDRNGAVRVWDLVSSQSRIVRRQSGTVRALAVTADGNTVFSTSGDGSTWFWDAAATPGFSADPEALRRWMSAVTTAKADVAGKLATPAGP